MREALWSQGWGRTVEFSSSLFWRNFVYLSLLPFLLCLVFFPLLPFLWHRRLGHVSSPRLRYFLSTGMLGSVPNINLSTCMGCKQGKDSALPLLRTLFLLLLLILCPKPILPLCYRKEDHPYMSFLTEQWTNWLKKRVSVLLLEVNISPLPSELCLLQLTSLTKRFPNDPAPNWRWEAPSIHFPFSVCPKALSLVYEPLSNSLTQSHEEQAQRALPYPVPRQPALTRLLALLNAPTRSKLSRIRQMRKWLKKSKEESGWATVCTRVH